VGQAGLNALDVAVELSDVAGELLAQSERSSILQVGAANLDQVLELLDLLLQSVAQGLEGGQEGVLELDNGGNVHDGREGVVGGGRHVDVIVGVDGLLGTHGTAQDLNGAVGDDLVGVHVGLGTGAGLPDDQREVVQQLTLSDLSGGLLDSLTDLGVWVLLTADSIQCEDATPTKTVLHVHGSGSTLENTESLDHGGGHAVLGLVDVEVTQRTVPNTVSAFLHCIPLRSEIISSGCLTAGSGHPSTCPQGPRYRTSVSFCGEYGEFNNITHLNLAKSVALSASTRRLEI